MLLYIEVISKKKCVYNVLMNTVFMNIDILYRNMDHT